jgi:hypothetical protein
MKRKTRNCSKDKLTEGQFCDAYPPPSSNKILWTVFEQEDHKEINWSSKRAKKFYESVKTVKVFIALNAKTRGVRIFKEDHHEKKNKELFQG